MRIISALLTCILVTSVCSSTASVASTDVDGAADRAQRARISLTASSEYVKKGGIVTLSGRVRGVRGRVKVTIFQKTKGKSSWNVEAIKRTSRKGRFVHREDVRSGDRTYRACVKRACDSVLVKMGKPPAADTAVGISGLSASAVEAGQAFAVSGVASANLNGRMVEVQAYDGASSSWGAVGRATVQGGSWSAPTAVTTAGRSVPLRAAFLGGVGLRPSTSGATSVTVFGWYYLHDMDDGRGRVGLHRGLPASAVAPTPTRSWRTPSYIGVDLQRRVRALQRGGRPERHQHERIPGVGQDVGRQRRALLEHQPGPGHGRTRSPSTSRARCASTSSLLDVTGEPDIVFGDAKVLCAF